MNPNDFFQNLENDMPFIKVGFQGFAGSGKTFTAVQLAINLHKEIKSDKPITLFDTERSFRTLKDDFKKAGIKTFHKPSRTLPDLKQSMKFCEEGYSDILVIDTISHVWENFTDAYMKDKQARQRRNGQRASSKLSFGDWGYLKPKWRDDFSTPFVNAKYHIIFSGRAGYEYEHEMDEESGKMTELRKSGIKMKAETETPYEPDLLFLMERHEEILGKKKKIWRTATCLKDRWSLIDGKTVTNPTYKFFKPCVTAALSGSVRENDLQQRASTFEELNQKSEDWMKKRDIALEEIKAEFDSMGLGTGKDERKLKVDLFKVIFGTGSWTKISTFRVNVLEAGLEQLKAFSASFGDYLSNCQQTSEKPNLNEAYEIMDQIIMPLEQQAELIQK